MGRTATVDSARLELWPGVRMLRATLALTVRVSAPTSYTLSLPQGSEVDRLLVDGRLEPVRQDGARLELILEPGRHELELGWQEPGGMSSWFSTPKVSLGDVPLGNVELAVHVPDGRWLLFAGGPLSPNVLAPGGPVLAHVAAYHVPTDELLK